MDRDLLTLAMTCPDIGTGLRTRIRRIVFESLIQIRIRGEKLVTYQDQGLH